MHRLADLVRGRLHGCNDRMSASSLRDFNAKRSINLRAHPSSARPLLLVNASLGFCTGTDSAPADCDTAKRGSWRLRVGDVSSWRTAATACASLCELCARCHFVSLSLKYRDCSWYHECSLTSLKRNLNGFVSARAQYSHGGGEDDDEDEEEEEEESSEDDELPSDMC